MSSPLSFWHHIDSSVRSMTLIPTIYIHLLSRVRSNCVTLILVQSFHLPKRFLTLHFPVPGKKMTLLLLSISRITHWERSKQEHAVAPSLDDVSSNHFSLYFSSFWKLYHYQNFLWVPRQSRLQCLSGYPVLWGMWHVWVIVVCLLWTEPSNEINHHAEERATAFGLINLQNRHK